MSRFRDPNCTFGATNDLVRVVDFVWTVLIPDANDCEGCRVQDFFLSDPDTGLMSILFPAGTDADDDDEDPVEEDDELDATVLVLLLLASEMQLLLLERFRDTMSLVTGFLLTGEGDDVMIVVFLESE